MGALEDFQKDYTKLWIKARAFDELFRYLGEYVGELDSRLEDDKERARRTCGANDTINVYESIGRSEAANKILEEMKQRYNEIVSEHGYNEKYGIETLRSDPLA